MLNQTPVDSHGRILPARKQSAEFHRILFRLPSVKITPEDIEKEKYKRKRFLEHVEEVEVSEENREYSVEKKIRDQRDEEVVDEGE